MEHTNDGSRLISLKSIFSVSLSPWTLKKWRIIFDFHLSYFFLAQCLAKQINYRIKDGWFYLRKLSKLKYSFYLHFEEIHLKDWKNILCIFTSKHTLLHMHSPGKKQWKTLENHQKVIFSSCVWDAHVRYTQQHVEKLTFYHLGETPKC